MPALWWTLWTNGTQLGLSDSPTAPGVADGELWVSPSAYVYLPPAAAFLSFWRLISFSWYFLTPSPSFYCPKYVILIFIFISFLSWNFIFAFLQTCQIYIFPSWGFHTVFYFSSSSFSLFLLFFIFMLHLLGFIFGQLVWSRWTPTSPLGHRAHAAAQWLLHLST